MPLSLHSSPVNHRIERFNTVVVGAGQAGLAVARELGERDVDVVVVSDELRVGDSWRRRWDSLRLFTPARFSGLPGMPFPAPPEHFPDKDEVADYLERYAERFDISVRNLSRITSIERHGDFFRLNSKDGILEASNIVIATGASHSAHIPALAQRITSEIVQLHSSSYKNPWTLPEGPVLVVGAGNSGAQIALELARTRKVWLAGRDTGRIPRRVIGRDIFAWVWPVISRATVDSRIGRALHSRTQHGGDALIGHSRSVFSDAGITRLPRVDGVRSELPVCDGIAVRPRVIIWATGFVPDFSWIHAPFLRRDGFPIHQRGVVSDVPGLYFVGLKFQHTLSSSLLGGVGADATFTAEHIAKEELR
ncbi:MAG: NAD(P)/FAD-dependent oxidoreductase [Gemmatimonadaceae bacterium]